MAIIRCKMCGGDLTLTEGQSVAECEYCGSRQTVPAADNEKKLTLFARAGRLRAACEFDKAAGIYETIVADFPEEAEAYWGLVLCKYGIEYVDDPGTGKKIPTCHRSSFESILEDADLEQALENADSAARRLYREEAKQIEQIRRGIIAVSANEQPYDIFICYKETDENGERTLDSVLAQDIYDALTEKGYRTFFSRITLEDKLGVEYEPYIFAALNSAKIMLAVGTDYEFYNAVWVKNEWSRYLKLMTQDKNKHLIPCYKGIDAYDMPREFAKLQAQDLGKMGAIQDILRGVEKLLPRNVEVHKESITAQQTTEVSSTQPLLRRAFLFLEDGDWAKADEYCEKVLDMNPECSEAYLGKLLSELQIHRKEDLVKCTSSFGDRNNYRKALRFADQALKTELEKSMDYVNSVLETEKNSDIENGVLRKYKGRQSHVVLPKQVTKISRSAFSDYKDLTSIEIPDTVTEIAPGAFLGCEKLSVIRVSSRHPNFRIAGTCLIDKNKKAVTFGIRFQDVPNDGSILSIGDSAFRGSEHLEEIRIPEGITEIGTLAFADCGSLQSVVIPKSVTAIAANALPHNPDIRIQVGDDHPVYRMAGSCLIHKQEKTVVFGTNILDLPADGSVTRIGTWAFSGCTMPESIVLSECINEICDHAFSECKNLQNISYFGKTLKIADNAFGTNTDNLTLYAFEDSEAARWAKKNRISTRENAEMKRITTASLLNRGNLALKNGDWSKAAGFFDGVLRNDSRNAYAYIGRTLVQEQCRSLDTMARHRTVLYREASTEKLYIQENTGHITEMAEKYSLPGYVEGNTIRKLYVFDRSYTSEVSGRQKQYLEEKSWWQNHRQLSDAEKYATEELAEQLQGQRKQILTQLSGRVRMAQEADARTVAALKAAYEAHITEADKQAEAMYNDGLAHREQDYLDWQEQSQKETDPKKLKALAEKFAGLGDYKESQNLAEACRNRAADEQAKIAAEKKQRRALAAQKKRAKRKRIGPILALISVITAACILLSGPVSQLILYELMPQYGYQKAEALLDDGRYEEALAAFESLGDYEDAAIRTSEIRYIQAESLLAGGQYADAIAAFTILGDYKDSVTRIEECKLEELVSLGKIRKAALGYYQLGNRERSMELWNIAADRETISNGIYHVVGLRNDGTVIAAGSNWDANKKRIASNGQCDVGSWEDIVDVEAGDFHTVGLRSDGTVVATGLNSDGQCDVSEWTDIVAVAAGYGYSAGLKADGTVLVAGNKDVTGASTWTDIISLAGGDEYIIGLKSGGNTISTKPYVIANRENVSKVAAGAAYVFLFEDGTVSSPYAPKGTKDIVDIFAGSDLVICKQIDGSLISKGAVNTYFFNYLHRFGWEELERKDVVAFSGMSTYAVVLHSDGTVAAYGEDLGGRCNVNNWTDIKIPQIPENFIVPDAHQSEEQSDAADYVKAESYLADGEIVKAAMAFGKLGDYEDSRERSLALWNAARPQETISAGQFRTMAVQKNGTMLSTDSRFSASGIVSVSDGSWHYAGLRSNGTVVAKVISEFPDKWKNIKRDQGGHSGQCDVADWRDMIQISAGDMHTLGLRKNGTVIGAGINDFGRWRTDTWQNIVAVSAGYDHSVGLDADGHVFTVGGNKNGVADTTLWKNIVAVSAGKFFTVGLQMDGTVIASGNNDFGQCDVSAYHDIIAVSAGNTHTVLLRQDGTVIAIGGNEYGQCNVSSWRDIVAIDAGGWHTVGLKSDGTMVAVGHTGDGRCEVAGWKNVKLPYREPTEFPDSWTDGKLPENPNRPKTDAECAAEYIAAEQLLAEGDIARAAIAFGKLGDYKDARQRSFALWDKVAVRDTIAVGSGFTLALKTDGTVYSTEGFVQDGMNEIEKWSDIIAVSACGGDYAGLKADGTVVVAGSAEHFEEEIREWHGIVAVSAGNGVMGLKSDGTVVAASYRDYDFSDWTEVIAIENTGLHNGTGGYHAVGLKVDGTVVAENEGDYYGDRYGQCDVEDWSDIVKISADTYLTLGLKADGTVVATGLKDKSQNFPRSGWEYRGQDEVSDWTDIRDICAHGYFLTMGVKKDGSVVAAGRLLSWYDPRTWTDIVAVAAGEHHAVGLKSDGTLVATGQSTYGRCDVSDWTDIKLPNKTYAPLVSQNIAMDSAVAYAEAEKLLASGETAKAAIAFGKLGDYEDARKQSMDAWSHCAVRELVSTSTHTVGIRSNGTVVAVGANDDGECKVSGWKNIAAVSVSLNHTVGLKEDGTVLAVGRNDNGKCDVSKWSEIIDISAGSGHTVGLKSDGTVVAVGWNGCEVSDWEDIADISAGGNHTVGLKSDGTVVATGMNDKGQCDVSDWENIVAVSAGYDNTAGLKADGTVVVVGSNAFGQRNVSDWQDIVSVSTGSDSIVGLKSDGTVVIAGRKDQGIGGVSDWQDIVAVNASYYHCVGLKSDGTVVAAGANNWGQGNISDWFDMKLPQ